MHDQFIGRLIFGLVIVSLTALAGPACANHVRMSEKDASRLDRYEPAGLRLLCLDVSPDEIKKAYPIDNHHIVFFSRDGRIFIGETSITARCRGLKNASGYFYEMENSDVLCAGDTIGGESGRSGGFSGSGNYVSGTSRTHTCEFTGFQQVRIRKASE